MVLLTIPVPTESGEYDPVGHVASVEGFDDKTIAAIAGGNARKLFGLN